MVYPIGYTKYIANGQQQIMLKNSSKLILSNDRAASK